jgi:hypothetical protein
MSTNIHALSSLLTQIQHLNSSDLRLTPLTPEQYQRFEERERQRERQHTLDIEEREFREKKTLSLEARRSLEKYFADNNGEIKRMNRVTHHSRKCVMALQSSDSSTGSETWFMDLWRQLLLSDVSHFQAHVEQTLGFKKHDFAVDVRWGSECEVIFYLRSVLDELVHRTFKSIEIAGFRVDSIQTAKDILHNPSTPTAQKAESQVFILDAYDR